MKISIIIPTYNRAEIIEDAILGFLKQTYQNIELIIIDDCSSDNTYDVVKKLKDNRVKCFRNKRNLGIEYSVFQGIQKMSGEFFTTMSDDDIYPDENFFQKVINLLNKHNDLDIVSGKYETIFMEDRLQNNFLGNEIYKPEEILNNINIFKQFCYGGNTIFRTTIWSDVILPKDHDISTVFKLIYNARKIGFINDVFYHWKLSIDDNSFSANMIKNSYKNLKWNMKFIDEVYSFLEENNDTKRFSDVIYSFISENFESLNMNYHLIKNDIYFSKIINHLHTKKSIYIYGKGFVGIELKKYLGKNNIEINGFIDDTKQESDINQLCDINKDSLIIISSYKNNLIHQMYKNILQNNIEYKNIIELI